MSFQESEDDDEPATSAVVFDGDFHLQVPMATLFEYVEKDSIRRKLERFGEPLKPASGWNGAYASEKSQEYAGSAGATTHGAAITREDISTVMDEMNLDYLNVTPPPNAPFASGRYPSVLKSLIRAYNDYLRERVLDADAGIYGSMMIPRWEPDTAIREIDRVAENEGIIGVSDWINFDQPFGAVKYDPLFEKLTELELPLVLHSGGELVQRRDPIGNEFRTYTENLVGGFTYPTVGNLLNMVMTGVFDKFPDLNVLMQEAGVSWLPLVLYRADEIYKVYGEDVHLAERLVELDQRHLQRLPSEYVLEHFYVTTQPIALPERTNLVTAMFELCRAGEMFLFSSDWPHGSLDTTDWVVETRGIDPELRSRIFSGNASELFGLEFAEAHD